MKTALLIGCASKNGVPIIETLLENGYTITNIGSSSYDHTLVNNIVIPWKDLSLEVLHKNLSKRFDKIDFIFFNQNASSLRQSDFKLDYKQLLTKWKLVRDWSHSNWISCQLPFVLLQTVSNSIHADTKVGWMLSDYVKHDIDGVSNYPDYSSFKFFNYLSMQCFADENNIVTFGIVPNFSKDQAKQSLRDVISDVISNNIDKKKIYQI